MEEKLLLCLPTSSLQAQKKDYAELNRIAYGNGKGSWDRNDEDEDDDFDPDDDDFDPNDYDGALAEFLNNTQDMDSPNFEELSDSEPDDPYNDSDEEYIGGMEKFNLENDCKLRRSKRNRRPVARFNDYQFLDTNVKKWDIPSLSRIIYERPFARNRIEYVDGYQVRFDFLRETGFRFPFLVSDPESIGLHLPSGEWTSDRLSQLIAPSRKLTVRDVERQSELWWTVTDWLDYFFHSHPRQAILYIPSVLANEISGTKLSHLIETPLVVRETDWIDHVWPVSAKIPRTKYSEEFHYPQVQLFFVSGSAGTFINFRIDGGGTSSWFFSLGGEVVFLLVRPSTESLTHYEAWYKNRHTNPAQNLFSDLIQEEAFLVSLPANHTFFIPCGWIYAIYAPSDMMLLQGRFMTSFNISLQLCVHSLEERLHYSSRVSFPFFRQIHWYAACYYIEVLRRPPFDITQWELQGLFTMIKTIANWLVEQGGAAPVFHPRELLSELELRLTAATNPNSVGLLEEANTLSRLTFLPPVPEYTSNLHQQHQRTNRKKSKDIINPDPVYDNYNTKKTPPRKHSNGSAKKTGSSSRLLKKLANIDRHAPQPLLL